MRSHLEVSQNKEMCLLPNSFRGILQHAHCSAHRSAHQWSKSREIGQTVSLYLTIYIYRLRALVRVWSSVWGIKRLQRDGGFTVIQPLSRLPLMPHIYFLSRVSARFSHRSLPLQFTKNMQWISTETQKEKIAKTQAVFYSDAHMLCSRSFYLL